jgi:hypothetical protein
MLKYYLIAYSYTYSRPADSQLMTIICKYKYEQQINIIIRKTHYDAVTEEEIGVSMDDEFSLPKESVAV